MICSVILSVLLIPVSAQTFTAPEAPQAAQKYLPKENSTFWDDFRYVFKSAVNDLSPHFSQALSICISVLCVVLLMSIIHTINSDTQSIINVVATVAIGVLLISPVRSLVALGTQTVQELNEYGKLLIPVITAALAAQGGVTASAAMCTITTFFCSLLTSLISKLLVPMVYIYLCLSVASRALGEEMLEKLKGTVKWLITWSLKTVLYLFTGFLTVTGVVSGSADASAVKAAKLTMSGFVPVVGGILSDASEAVLVGAEVMKNTIGVYGLLAILALWIGPFLQIGVQYLLVKVTAGVCDVFGSKQTSGLVQDFSGGMGILLAMTGAECIILLISIVCFMKGIT